LVNISFLNAQLVSAKFVDCIFVECYFRKSQLRDSTFIGCRFIDCNFDFADLSSCDFRYSKFRGSVLAYDELRYSAPSEPNLRRDLFFDLSRAASALGNDNEARSYRLAAIDAANENLRGAVLAKSAYYKEHYPLDRRAGAFLTLVWHQLNRWLWRHGESAWRLLSVALLAAFGLFPLLLFLGRGGTGRAHVDYGDAIWMSVSNFLSVDRVSDLPADSAYLQAASAAEGLLGVVFAGLYVTLVVKALLRR
jgi:hypothetical protein